MRILDMIFDEGYGLRKKVLRLFAESSLSSSGQDLSNSKPGQLIEQCVGIVAM